MSKGIWWFFLSKRNKGTKVCVPGESRNSECVAGLTEREHSIEAGKVGWPKLWEVLQDKNHFSGLLNKLMVKEAVSVIVLCLAAQSCLTLCSPMNCSPPGSSVHGDSPGKNTGVSCHALLQEIFPIQGSNPGLLHCGQILNHLSQCLWLSPLKAFNC